MKHDLIPRGIVFEGKNGIIYDTYTRRFGYDNGYTRVYLLPSTPRIRHRNIQEHLIFIGSTNIDQNYVISDKDIEKIIADYRKKEKI